MKLIESILADAAAIAAVRRDIHAHPELCFQEQRTSDVIAQQLTDWGIPIHRGMGTTGVVAILKNGSSDRAVGLRADIDALPMTEHNRFAHASRHAGKMHACGHDGHTAMLLAAAKHLSRHRHYDGTVYLVFQPAEEGGGGAREMIKDGLFDKFPMEAMFGAHNWPGMAVGQFALKSGPCFASSNEFKITIRGKGCHAAMPNNGIDPVPVACQLVQGFQTIISRNKRPIDAGVISVTMIHTGEATNVVPDTCVIEGTVRTFTLEVLDLIERRMKVVAENTCAAFETSCEFEFQRNYPPTINHAAETEFARGVMTEMVGAANVQEFEPTMGAEDFSYFLLEKPGCYFLIGNGDGSHRVGGHGMGPCMLHNPSYDFNDELIPLGATLWVRLAEAWLAGEASGMTRVAQHFAQSYAEARAKFLAGAEACDLDVESHAHPMLGRDGEALAMDVVRIGAADASSLLIISSACHGVEGFCGSGVQVALLNDRAWRRALRDTGVAVLCIHALNPYGFSWWRRTTHENVDLNRNFHDFGQPLPRNAAYDDLAAWLVPATWPPADAVNAAIARFMAEHGERALQEAVTGGQYDHPEGLFYGGRNPTWSHVTLRHVLQEHGRRCQRLGWIDLHTGLGPSGVGERIFACRDDATAMRRARAWWGPNVTSIYDGTSSSAPLTGLMWMAAYQECEQAEYTGIAMEYGTVPTMEVISALRADQWLENHPEAGDAQRRAIKQQVRDAFYTDTDVWKQRIVEQAVEAAQQAVRGLAQG